MQRDVETCCEINNKKTNHYDISFLHLVMSLKKSI